MDFWKTKKSTEDVHLQVQSLFSNDPDLVEGFEQFLPNSVSKVGVAPQMETEGATNDEVK